VAEEKKDDLALGIINAIDILTASQTPDRPGALMERMWQRENERANRDALQKANELAEEQSRLLESKHREAQAVVERLRAAELELARLRHAAESGIPCPHCGGSLPPDAATKAYHVCKHCRNALFWVDSAPFCSAEAAAERRCEIARHAEAQRLAIAAAAEAAYARAAAEKAAAQLAAAARKAEEDARPGEARRAVDSALCSSGVVSSVTECTLHTSVGPLVFRLCRDWSERWTLWFATAIKAGLWANAEIIQIAPRGNLKVEHGWFGKASLRGERQGSSILLRIPSEVFWPVRDVLLEALVPSLDPPTIQKQTQAHEWKLWAQSGKPTSTVTITNSPSTPDNTSRSQGAWIGFLDTDASWETLLKLESLPVDYDNQDRLTQPVVISGATLRSLGDDASALSIDDKSAFASLLLSFETCIQACAVVAATDSKLSPSEMAQVVIGLAWSGRRKKDIQHEFVVACQRAHADGAEKWIGSLAENVRIDRQRSHSGGSSDLVGMPHAELIRLLRTLSASVPTDSARKAGLVAQIKKVLAVK